MQLRARGFTHGRVLAKDAVDRRLVRVAHVEGEVRRAVDVRDDRLRVRLGAEVRRGQGRRERRLALVQPEERDRVPAQPCGLECLYVRGRELAVVLALREVRLRAQQGLYVERRKAGEGLLERA